MNLMRKQASLGIQAGDTFAVTRTFTAEDVQVFGDTTRDYNPVHYDREFAGLKGFNGLICHGLLTGAMICEIGGQIGWLAAGMDFKFIRPVYFGDTITCRFTITEVDDQGRAQAQASYINQQGRTVASCHISGRLPRQPERERLSDMIAEGDPTNKLR